MRRIISIGAIIATGLAVQLYRRSGQEVRTAPEKVLVTTTEAQVKGFDPVDCEDTYSAREVCKVYEGLLEYHYLNRPYALTPNLAAEMPTLSADQCVYTFKIKEGVTFQDNACFPGGKGRVLTAHDFVYSFKRLADPRRQSRCFWLLDGKIKGLNAWREKYVDVSAADYTEDIPGLQALDNHTLQITLTQPSPQFLYALAMAPCFVVAHEAVDHYGKTFLNHPVGTGPFTLQVFNPQDTQIVYHRNPTFRDKRFPTEAAPAYTHMLTYAGQKLPLVDMVITHIFPEAQPRWLKFQKGQVDVIDISKDNIASEIIRDKELVSTLQDKGIQLFQEPEITTSCVIFNNAHPLFKNNPKLRQAMSLAFDGAKYNELFCNGAATLAQSIIPPNLAGHQTGYRNPYRAYNIDKAKQYLAEAGYPGGQGLPRINLDGTAHTIQKQKAEFFQQSMQKIGIQIQVVGNTWPELVKKVQTKNMMLHSMSWSADYPDAENFLQLFYGPHQLSGLGVNSDDPVFNKLYEKAVTMPHSAERTALYEHLNHMIGEQTPVICTVHAPHLILHQGWVRNYIWSNFHYGVEQYIDVDLAQKQALKPKLQ